MKLSFFFILGCCVLLWGIGTIACAEPVTMDKAETAAGNFLLSRYPAEQPAQAQTQATTGVSSLKIRDIAPLQTSDALLGYVAHLDPQGYILLSADDCAPPVKLYSEDGSFEKLPPGFRAVIEAELLEDLTCLSSPEPNTLLPSARYRQQWNGLLGLEDNFQALSEPSTSSAGGPLLMTAWYQIWPYNYYCPYAAGGTNNRALTGCVATAFAQILRHHRQPVRVLEDYTYTDERGSCTGTHSISDAGMGDYDWANMPYSISDSSPEAQKKAVGQLIYHCAVAVEADFEAARTGAWTDNIPFHLWTFFGYRSGGIMEWKGDYSSSAWYSKIASDIDANRPLFYEMWTSDWSIGHALVCDGYRNGNEIHLEFGWSGAGTAWYNIDTVVDTRYGFTWTIHFATFGITPSSIQPPMTIYVNASATGANNGSSWADAYTDLQSALPAALSGDEIWVAKGTYKPTTDTDRTACFLMKQCAGIYGGFAGTETSRDQRDWVANPTILSGDIGIQGDNSDNSYNVLAGALLGGRLDGFTITAGNASGEQYYYQSGGGMDNWGGGTISNCTFIGNSASDYGGGLANHWYDATVINCLFIGNSAKYGGGMFTAVVSPTLTNCTFIGNSAAYGAGICSEGWDWDYNLTLSNCIFGNNTAAGANEIALERSMTIDIDYCDIKGGRSAIYDDGTGIINWGTGNIDVDPCFVDPGYRDANGTADDANDDFWVDGDYHLRAESLCINSGDPNYIPEPNETDLDGKPRIIGGRIDMGAYEFNHNPIANAGPNQVAYAWIDGFDDVNLDGSASYDDDNDILNYHWFWLIDDNTCETNGVNPTIKLPVGKHQIELIVDDGIDESEPDYCTIEVFAPLQVKLLCIPSTLNSRDHQRWILAVISMPLGVRKTDINLAVPLVFYPGPIESKQQFAFEFGWGWQRGTYVWALFNKSACIEQLEPDINKINVVGRLTSGRYFDAAGCLRLVRTRWHPGPPHRPPYHRS
jgi:hypothetical protein